MGTLFHFAGNANWYNHFGYQFGYLRNYLPQDPKMPLLGIYPKDAQSYYKDMCSTMFIAALFIYLVIDRTWKQPKCPSTEK